MGCQIKRKDSSTMEVPLLEVYKPQTTTATQELCPPITTVYKTNTKSQNANCKTTSIGSEDEPSHNIDKPCIFPFTVYLDKEKTNNKTYYGCTKEGCGKNECKDFWCSIKVDNMDYIQLEGAI